MYVIHPLIVIDPCAKYGMPMSKQTELIKKPLQSTNDIACLYNISNKQLQNIQIINFVAFYSECLVNGVEIKMNHLKKTIINLSSKFTLSMG